MKCHRCGSVMVYERFLGRSVNYSGGDAFGAEKS